MPSTFRKQVYVCTNAGEQFCGGKGAEATLAAFKEEVKKQGLTDIIITRTGCTGQHRCGPTVIVHPDGVWYKEVTAEAVPEIVAQHLKGGHVVESHLNPEMKVTGP